MKWNMPMVTLEEVTANIIAENLISQVDEEGVGGR
jgi:hypothetical protein